MHEVTEFMENHVIDDPYIHLGKPAVEGTLAEASENGVYAGVMFNTNVR